MNFPAELQYTKSHEWVKMEGDVAVIGITDFAQDALGDVGWGLGGGVYGGKAVGHSPPQGPASLPPPEIRPSPETRDHPPESLPPAPGPG